MAGNRKLQGEIDRCLKKVQEGVDTFEDIWQKVYSSANANQKEKYEADLKKEIKKLQRQRDQIKTWLSSSDIKDKRILIDNRKLIETQMERFKVVERETKTKAYSKEGLGAASKLDPAAKEKQEVTNWISQQIDSLNIQTDHFESEIEQLSTGNKKKKMDKDKGDRYEHLKAAQDKHTYHIQKLETIMRMVDNDALPLEQIKGIRDDIEYYVDSNQDPDFEENEMIYDELELDDLDPTLHSATSPPHDEDRFSDKLSTTPTSTNSSSPSPSPGITNHSKDDERKKHKSNEDNRNKNNSATSSSSSSSVSSSSKLPNTPTKINSYDYIFSNPPLNCIENSNHLPNATPPTHGWLDGQNSNSDTTKSQSNSLTNHVSGLSSSVSSSVLVNSITSSINTSVNSVSPNSVGNPSILPHGALPMLNNGHGKESVSPPMLSSPVSSSAVNSNNNSLITSLSSSLSSTLPSSQANAMNSLSTSKTEILPGVMNGPLSAGGVLHKDVLSEEMSSLKSIAQQAVMNAGLEDQIPSSTDSTSSDTKVPFNSSVSQLSPQPSPGSQDGSLSSQPLPQTTTIHLNRLLGVAPLGPVPLVKEHVYQLTMGEAAFHHLPHPSDSERLRHYLPRNPCPTPPYYPQLPPPHADSVEFFQRLSTETLFFIFYYMEGTKAQYLAAKALKKQSWRFHTKYMMWFQRHEEPKTINEDYEQGTYIYFDYEKWGQRKKEGFTFEYRYLEDRDLN
ncbi:CCR4-NOT transcription complex subunit 3-like isoform X4 [Ruditapes philippinarum]|uniref:CCR4-NOT transcription complex subunit 3-like isoform X4 n=1 Tax=Ruditapes philippinarum TaxID=129788 RepID=UPI00295B3CBB|nr:CCR4-NOT transcription complex subunit 3-like isoform X4 [Ruditapes philippinarum]